MGARWGLSCFYKFSTQMHPAGPGIEQLSSHEPTSLIAVVEHVQLKYFIRFLFWSVPLWIHVEFGSLYASLQIQLLLFVVVFFLYKPCYIIYFYFTFLQTRIHYKKWSWRGRRIRDQNRTWIKYRHTKTVRKKQMKPKKEKGRSKRNGEMNERHSQC